VIRWLLPSAAGSVELSKLIRSAHTASEQSIFFAVVIGPDCPMPGMDCRRALVRDHDELTDILMASHVVLLGQTLRQAMIRSVLAGLGLLLGKRMSYETDPSPSVLAKAISTQLGIPAGSLRKKLLAAGILDAAEFDV